MLHFENRLQRQFSIGSRAHCKKNEVITFAIEYQYEMSYDNSLEFISQNILGHVCPLAIRIGSTQCELLN